jgi:hypothetical protein
LVVMLVIYPGVTLELIRNGAWVSPFDYSSAIFPVTYGASAAAFVLFVMLGKKKLGWYVAAAYSFSNVVGAIGLYELVLDEFFPNTMYLGKLLMLTFVLFGTISLQSRKLSMTEFRLVFVWIVLFFAWVFVDPTIPASRSDTIPFLFNAVTKVAAFAVFSIPLYLGLRSDEELGKESESNTLLGQPTLGLRQTRR